MSFNNKNLKGLATPKQKAYLKKFGISFSKELTKQEASTMIGESLKKDRAQCKTCGKILKSKDGNFECCGYKESRPLKRGRGFGRSLEEIVFKLQTGMSYSEAEHWNVTEFNGDEQE